MNWKSILILIIAIIGAFAYLIFSSGKQRSVIQQTREEYFSQHTIEMNAIVTNKIISDHDWGILCLSVSKSNLSLYDPFKSQEKYFFYYVKDGYGEIYTGGISQFNIGDSLVVRTNDDSMYIYRNRTKVDTWPLYVPTNDNYYDWVRKHHKEGK